MIYPKYLGLGKILGGVVRLPIASARTIRDPSHNTRGGRQLSRLQPVPVSFLARAINLFWSALLSTLISVRGDAEGIGKTKRGRISTGLPI